MTTAPILTPTLARAVEKMRSGELEWGQLPAMTRVKLPMEMVVFSELGGIRVNKTRRYRKLTFGKAEKGPSYAADDSKTYPVLLDGEVIGYVQSHREDSWRSLPSGVRYSKRGEPKAWRASLRNGLFSGSDTIGFQFDSRDDAALAIVEHLQEEGKVK